VDDTVCACVRKYARMGVRTHTCGGEQGRGVRRNRLSSLSSLGSGAGPERYPPSCLTGYSQGPPERRLQTARQPCPAPTSTAGWESPPKLAGVLCR
jgi:hypothetical protein